VVACAPFDSVFAPTAGLEPATGRLTRPAIVLIEDVIHFSLCRNRNQQGAGSRRSGSPLYGFALVASVLYGC